MGVIALFAFFLPCKLGMAAPVLLIEKLKFSERLKDQSAVLVSGRASAGTQACQNP